MQLGLDVVQRATARALSSLGKQLGWEVWMGTETRSWIRIGSWTRTRLRGRGQGQGREWAGLCTYSRG